MTARRARTPAPSASLRAGSQPPGRRRYEIDASVVTDRAADSVAAGISFCRALFLAGSAPVGFHGGGCDFGGAGASDSRAGFGACAQERVAGDFRALCLYAQSALSGIVADRAGILRGGAELVGSSFARRNVSCYLCSRDRRRGGFFAADFS